MISNLTAIIGILVVGIPLMVLIMLLPALLELKKPKDGGPRLIMDNINDVQIQILRMTRVTNIESEQKFDIAIVSRLAKIIGVLPNLEV
jgi:hypothetical protein